MPRAFLLDPAALRERLATRYRNQCRDWLAGGGDWPLSLPLGVPSERQARVHLASVRAWQASWARWPGPGEVRWTDRRWPLLGTQRLPETLTLDEPEAVAAFIGQAEEWQRARRRYLGILEVWPALAAVLPRHLEVLAGWPDRELEQLAELLRWLLEHPRSELYIRQLPVAGIDTKWLEGRQKVVKDWLGAIAGEGSTDDLYALTGLRRLPVMLRMRVLDPGLRHRIGGLGDIQAPVAELAALELPIERVLIVENLQTGLALEDMSGTVAFMGQGYAVEPFGEIPWLGALPCYYWGDLDTHGLAILDGLRQYLPWARSLLMDEATLLAYRELWSHEASPAYGRELPRLDPAESALYQALCDGRWGPGVRLEQERIPWGYVMDGLSELRAGAHRGDVARGRSQP